MRRSARARCTRCWNCTSSRGRSWRPRAATIGVVTHGQGLWWLEITLTGKDAHTGSTPMNMRVNAGLGMARITERVHQIAMSHQPNAVGAVGQVKVFPNSRNVIPGKVVFTVDIRSPEQAKLDAMKAEVDPRGPCGGEGAGAGLRDRGRSGHFDPVTFDPGLVKIVRGSRLKSWAIPTWTSSRGAGHDACWINRVAPDGDGDVPLRGRAVATTRPRRFRRNGRRRGRMCCCTRCLRWRRWWGESSTSLSQLSLVST